MLNQHVNNFYENNILDHINNNQNQDKDVKKVGSKILLVEDNEIISKVNAIFLREKGYEVDIAKNGYDAISLLKNSYRLILLDIGLPDIDGIEICKIIRKRHDFINTPIIFLTAFGENLEDECFEAGGNDFAVKPLTLEKLCDLVDWWV